MLVGRTGGGVYQSLGGGCGLAVLSGPGAKLLSCGCDADGDCVADVVPRFCMYDLQSCFLEASPGDGEGVREDGRAEWWGGTSE